MIFSITTSRGQPHVQGKKHNFEAIYIYGSSRYGEYEGNATRDSLHHILVRIDLVD